MVMKTQKCGYMLQSCQIKRSLELRKMMHCMSNGGITTERLIFGLINQIYYKTSPYFSTMHID